ncbi:MAG: 30S ribosomal protein S13 [Planctomycetes bacterium]|nr:30S ribosomal protein S13 [Planctomycetota bacterium]
MPRIQGVDIPADKKIPYSLAYIYGVGIPTAQRICADLKIDPDQRAKDLTEEELAHIAEWIDKTMPVEGTLRRQIAVNIQRLKEIGTYRGLRHRKGLPVRGQRTKTNSRTRKGPRKTVAGKKGAKVK